MSLPPYSLREHHSVLTTAVGSTKDVSRCAQEATGTELGEWVRLLDDLSARAAAARTVMIAEAMRRGEVDSTLSVWLRKHAPSLRQGGVGQTSRVVTDVVGGGPAWSTGCTAPDPESPLGIVWAAVTGADCDLEGDSDGEAAPSAATPDTSASAGTSGVPDPASLWGKPERDAQPEGDTDRPAAVGEVPITTALGCAVLSEMRLLEPRLVPEAVPTVTHALVRLGREWGPAHMRKFRAHLLARYGAPGELGRHQDKLAKGAFLSSPSVESLALTEYRMALTPEQAATLEAVIGPLSAPAPNAETGERDSRPMGQRRAEALVEILQGASAAVADGTGGSEGVGGSWAALHLTMDLASLRALTGCEAAVPGSHLSVPAPTALSGEVLASLAAGAVLAPEHLRRIACQADLIPQVLGTQGEVLDQGRVRRLFDRAQRRLLLRRDKGCTYPGCDRPAAWARAHHVLHWFDGGASDPDNAALLCQRHHTVVHAKRLWAEVSQTPDCDGRHVHWDLTPGSYDRELDRLRRERAMNDPPPLTPERLALFRRALAGDDRDEHRWASFELSLYDVDPEFDSVTDWAHAS